MAPSSKSARPAQYKQSSRKGKKAWRKNIDLTDIEKSIEDKIEQEITHGVADLSTLKNDALFAVDNTGDDELKSKLIKRKQIKKNLKSKEILESIKTNSKVSALKHHKHDSSLHSEKKGKIQGVSKKKLNKLLALAGKVQGESKLKNRLNKDGLIKSDTKDLWGDEPVLKNDSKKSVTLPSGIKLDINSETHIPEELLSKSTTSWSLPSVAPSTSKIEPVQVRKYESVPHSGKSYNPESKEWNSLLITEYKKEVINEEKRVQLVEYKEKIKHLMETLNDNEEEDEDTSDESSDEADHTTETKEDGSDYRLSINDPVKNKKKTKYQRNKAKKHEEKVKLQQELKTLKIHVKKLEMIEEIGAVVEEESKIETTSKVTKERRHNKNKLGTKYGILDERLEIKFSDELSDSLRKLKPEGNLLYDNVRKLQSSGKIESRIPLQRGRRYKQNITEKWTHKDFK
ncbi:similar to Saccharomyces cerevisiae YPL146C NOP53 Nucleolar protein [Maudiozyma saulgeensis]|uniref:Ribosome biogenesis protein NOP53 n=1 Tax=Maudiozyma saulgeensis TaxID=1789683 RepID=A0A1X7R8X2_9SACH|nr:similar to Saccharomyces cerevisiae YPL146C NOP53 Nucleolar protein [Kazachstania saulgeensis]